MNENGPFPVTNYAFSAEMNEMSMKLICKVIGVMMMIASNMSLSAGAGNISYSPDA